MCMDDDVPGGRIRICWGRITGPLSDLGDDGLLLFGLSLLLLFWFPRFSAAIAIVASLLASPLLLYFVAPGPFRRVFKGNWSVHLNSSFVWNTWAVFGIYRCLRCAHCECPIFRPLATPKLFSMKGRQGDGCSSNHGSFSSQDSVPQGRRFPSGFTKRREFLIRPATFRTEGQQDRLCV